MRTNTRLAWLACGLALGACSKGPPTGPNDGGQITYLGDGGPTGHHDAGTIHDAGIIVMVDSGPTQLTISSVSPNRGPTAGGIPITISGSGFLSGLTPGDPNAAATVTTVSFGGNTAIGAFILTDGTLQISSPAGTAGTSDVTIDNPNGQTTCSGCFLYQAPIEIDQVSPSSGPLAGGTAITVLGLGFDSSTVLLLGGSGALQTTLVSPTELTALSPAGAAPGPVSARAFNSNGSASLFDAFTYFATPSATALSPPFGPFGGGTAVTLTGAGFLGQSVAVTVGGAAAAAVVVVDDATVTFTTPPGTAGPATVVVSDGNGTAALTGAFVYIDPTVSTFGLLGVVPPSGHAGGGTPVSLVGTGFTLGDFGVSFGDAGPVSTTVSSVNLATAATPAAAAPGTVDVIADGGAFAATLPSGFSYLADRTVSGIAPATGPSSGGTSVTVTGEGFLPDDQLWIGPLPSTTVNVVSGTSLTATTPAGSAGPANVTLIGADGGNRATLAAGFMYVDPFALAQVNPAGGSQAGGTYVELLGTGFGLGDVALFGGVPAGDLELVDGYTLSCLTPPGMPGPVDVTVTAPADAGVSTLAGGYSYFDPTNTSGGQTGGPLDGTLNVTVLSNSYYSYDAPIQGATVRLGLDPQTPFQGTTDVNGQITFSDPTLVKPQTVTATFVGIATTVDDVTQQNLSVFLDIPVGNGAGGLAPCPCSQNGSPPNCPDNCGLPFCSLLGICVQCLSDSDCQNPSNPGYSPSTPHCYPGGGIGGLCVHCTSDSDCTDDPSGNKACDDERGTQSTFTCVQCTADTFCPMGDYCNTQDVTCVPSDIVEGTVSGFKLPPNVTVGPGCDMEAHVGILQPAVYYYEPFTDDPTEYVVTQEGGGFGFQLDASSLNLALYAKFGINCGGGFTPYLLGVVRNIAVDPQNPATGITILLDTHLDQSAPISFQNSLAPPPSQGTTGGSTQPVAYDTFAYLDLGQSGVVPLTDVLSDAGGAVLGALPPLQGNGILFLTQAFQELADGGPADPAFRSPTSVFFRSVDDDFTTGVPMGPLLPFVIPVQPPSGGALNGTFQWSFAGSTPAVGTPDLTQINLIEEQVDSLGDDLGETVLWNIIVPGSETEVQVPDDLLQQIVAAIPMAGSGLSTLLFWQIGTANAPRFDYAYFSYSDLNENAWTAFQTTQAQVTP